MWKSRARLAHWCRVGCTALFLILGVTGCATARVVHVVDENGAPIPNALVIFSERNLSPIFPIKMGAGFADLEGNYLFEAYNQACVAAFGEPPEWGWKYIAARSTDTVVVASAPYTGYLLEGYLERASHVPEDVRRRLEVFFSSPAAETWPAAEDVRRRLARVRDEGRTLPNGLSLLP